MTEEDLSQEVEEEEAVEEETEEVVEEGDSEIPEQWRKLDKKGLAKVLRDKDSFIGKLQDEKRQSDARADNLAGRLGTLEERYQKESSRPEKEETIEFDYDKPAESISKIVDRRLASSEKATQEHSAKALFDRCSRAHKDGFAAAVAANPKLFEGIETDVNDNVFTAMNPYVVGGQDISDELRKTETFTDVARWLRVKRNELDYLKDNTIEPVSDDFTERPQSGGSTGTRKSPKSLLTPKIQDMMKDFKISEKEAMAMAKEVQEEDRRKR